MTELLAMLGGLPLALVITGGLMATNPNLGFAEIVESLRRNGAVIVLNPAMTGSAMESAEGIPVEFYDKVGRSFGALLIGTWDAIPSARPLLRDVLKALGCSAENAFIPDAMLPFMVEAPPADPLGLAPDPLEAGLRWLDDAQLLERNQAREVRLHPLIHRFALERADQAFRTAMGSRILNCLMDPEQYAEASLPALLSLAIELDATGGIEGCDARTMAELSAVARMLSNERYNLRRTTTPQSGLSIAPQLAYAASLYNRAKLREVTADHLRGRREPHLAVRWTTITVATAVRHRLRGHKRSVSSCAVSGDGKVGLSTSNDNSWRLSG